MAVGQAVYMARHFAEIGERTAMGGWIERLEMREAYQASLPPEGTAMYVQSFYPPLEADKP